MGVQAMIVAPTLLLVAALSTNNLTVPELESYYWDCDTAFMKGELGGQDTWSCLAITEELQKRVFHDNKNQFLKWWNKHKHQEWQRRGYLPKDQS